VASLATAAFRSEPFQVRVGEHTLWFPHLTADYWVRALSPGSSLLNIVQLMSPEEYDRFLDLLLSGDISAADVPRIANRAVSEAGGRPYWESQRLVSSVFEPTGRVLGSLMLHGVHPETMTLAAYCSAIWALLTRNADTTEMMKAEAQLSVPPPDADPEDLPDDGFDAALARARSAPGVRIG
jgi:hypothetical protein